LAFSIFNINCYHNHQEESSHVLQNRTSGIRLS